MLPFNQFLSSFCCLSVIWQICSWNAKTCDSLPFLFLCQGVRISFKVCAELLLTISLDCLGCFIFCQFPFCFVFCFGFQKLQHDGVPLRKKVSKGCALNFDATDLQQFELKNFQGYPWSWLGVNSRRAFQSQETQIHATENRPFWGVFLWNQFSWPNVQFMRKACWHFLKSIVVRVNLGYLGIF